MKQFLLTMAGVFAGLVLFFIGVPFLLLTMIAGAARPAPTPGATIPILISFIVQPFHSTRPRRARLLI